MRKGSQSRSLSHTHMQHITYTDDTVMASLKALSSRAGERCRAAIAAAGEGPSPDRTALGRAPVNLTLLIVLLSA